MMHHALLSTLTRRRAVDVVLRATLGLAGALCLVGAARAEFPERPIKLVVSSAPGGYLDVISRAVGRELQAQWGQPVVIDNKPGASGALGAVAVQNSKPDGYTWLAATEAHLVTNKFTQKNLPYDYQRDFVGVSVLTKADQVLVAAKDFPANSLAELIDRAKKEPQGLSYGSWGIGSHPHMFFSKLGSLTGGNFVMIPYKGVAPTIQAITSGEVQLSVMSPGTAKPLLESGRVKVLATASDKRLPSQPDVPTTEELGFPGLQSSIYMILLLPKATPPAIVAKASSAVQAIMNRPEFAKTLVTDNGFQVVASDANGVTATLDKLSAQMADSVKSAGIKLD